MRKLLLAGLLFGSATMPARAQDVTLPNIHTGNGLYELCVSGDASRHLICSAYILGVADAVQGDVFCPPRGAANQQAIDVVRNALTSHPEQRQEPSASLVMLYLNAAWPCHYKQAPKAR
jgi:hypothetical protein